MGKQTKQPENEVQQVKKAPKLTTKSTWKKRIKAACEKAGTYQPCFDHVIDTLAEILTKRDAAEKTFIDGGSFVLVKHTNKNGAVNLEQNPAVRLINDLNRDALAYWRDLGLTPAGLKRINEKGKTDRNDSSVGDILRSIGVG